MTEWIWAAVVELLLLSSWALLGFRVARTLAPGLTRLETAAVSFPLGTGVLTFSVFMASWIGVPLRAITVLGIELVLFLLVAAFRRLRRRLGHAHVDSTGDEGRPRSSRWTRWLFWITLGAVGLVSVAIAVGRSHTVWDASALWAAKGYGIALKGTILAAREWGAHGLAYPLHIPLLISFFQLFTGDVLPGSMAVFPLFFLSMLTGMVAFWRRLAVADKWTFMGVGIVATVPTMFHYATYGYANIPFAAYVALGCLWGVFGVTRESGQHATVAGLLLATSIWTRPEGVLYALAILVSLLGARFLAPCGRIDVGRLAGPTAVLAALWFAFYLVHGVSGSQAGASVERAVAGWRVEQFRWEDLRLILGYLRRSMLQTNTWGLLFPVSFVLIGLRLKKLLARAVPEITLLALATTMTGLVTGGLFYVGSYAVDGLLGWLTSSFPRAFFPTAILLATLAFALAPGSGSGLAGDHSAMESELPEPGAPRWNEMGAAPSSGPTSPAAGSP